MKLEKAMYLVLRHEEWLVGDVSFYLKFWTKFTHPLQKRRLPTYIRSCTSAVTLSGKEFNYDYPRQIHDALSNEP